MTIVFFLFFFRRTMIILLAMVVFLWRLGRFWWLREWRLGNRFWFFKFRLGNTLVNVAATAFFTLFFDVVELWFRWFFDGSRLFRWIAR